MGCCCSAECARGIFHAMPVAADHDEMVSEIYAAHPWTQQLTPSQIVEIYESFLRCDVDGSGYIDGSEMTALMTRLGIAVSPEWLEHLMSAMDKDGNGTIDFEEYLLMMAKRVLEGDSQAELDRAFQMLDKDGNGQIPFQELRDMLSQSGQRMSDEEVDKMLVGLDVNKDGKISLEEFAALPFFKVELPAELRPVGVLLPAQRRALAREQKKKSSSKKRVAPSPFASGERSRSSSRNSSPKAGTQKSTSPGSTLKGSAPVMMPLDSIATTLDEGSEPVQNGAAPPAVEKGANSTGEADKVLDGPATPVPATPAAAPAPAGTFSQLN